MYGLRCLSRVSRKLVRSTVKQQSILYFTNPDVREFAVPQYLESLGHSVEITFTKPSTRIVRELGTQVLIADRARSLVPSDVLELLPRRAINLHPSLLPWNRGYNPLLWSAAKTTPNGVSVHYMDSGIDSGAILSQTAVELDEALTLSTAYEVTRRAMLSLFRFVWETFEDLSLDALSPIQNDVARGCLHSRAESLNLIECLPLAWETPLEKVGEIYRQAVERGELVP